MGVHYFCSSYTLPRFSLKRQHCFYSYMNISVLLELYVISLNAELIDIK